MATKARRRRRRYSDEQRRTILETAQREGLTAADVHKKFGVTPVTYYSWRKKSKLPARRGRPPGRGRAVAATGQGDLTSLVQQKVRAILPTIVRHEVNSYLDQVLATNGAAAPRRRRRRVKA